MNRTEICDVQFEELFKCKRKQHPTDPEFMDILQKFIFGEVSTVGKIDNKLRELITITVLSVMQTLPQLKAHIQVCLNINLTPVVIRETIYNVAPFIGFPKTLNAISAMNEVFEKNNISLPLENQGTVSENDRLEKGQNLQNPLYGNEIAEKYKNFPQEFGKVIPQFLTELCFGDFYSRNGVSLKTRELLIVCIFATLGITEPMKSHIEANLKLGNEKNIMYAAILQCLPYIGFLLAFQAFDTIVSVNQ